MVTPDPAPVPAAALKYIAAFCRQTARDGILPSLAWFTETADTIDAALPEARRQEDEKFCECCGEPAGEGGALCPACQESR